MYELKKKIGKVLMSKDVGTGPSSYEKRIYWAAVSQRLRNIGLCNVDRRHSKSFLGEGNNKTNSKIEFGTDSM